MMVLKYQSEKFITLTFMGNVGGKVYFFKVLCFSKLIAGCDSWL